MSDLNKQISVSIILPCYNEKGNIISIIDQIHEILDNNNIPHEIIVIDDNSPDGTYSLIKDKNYSFVNVHLNKYVKGLASSIRMGIEQSQYDHVVLMDSDFNHLPVYLPILIFNLRYYDCVVASRFIYGGSSYSNKRYFLSWIYNIFIRISTRNMITDSLYGYLSFKKSLLSNLETENIFWGFGDYCIRLLYYFQLMKVPVLQIPATHGNRVSGVGNRKFIKTFYRYTISTLKLTFTRKTDVLRNRKVSNL